MLDDVSIDLDPAVEHDDDSSYMYFSISITAFITMIAFICLVIVVFYNNSQNSDQQKSFLVPISKSKGNSGAYIKINFTNLKDQTEYLSVSYRFIRYYSEIPTSCNFSAISTAYFVNNHGKTVKKITYNAISFTKDFQPYQTLSSTQDFINTPIYSFDKINIDSYFNFISTEIRGIQVKYSFGGKTQLNVIRITGNLLSFTGWLLFLYHFYYIWQIHSLSTINIFSLIFCASITLISNPLSKFFSDSSFLMNLFGVLFLLIYRFYTLSVTIDFSFHLHKNKNDFVILAGILSSVIGFLDFISQFSKKHIDFIPILKKISEFKTFDFIEVFFIIIYCSCFITFAFVAILRSPVYQTLSLFFISGIFATLYSKVFFAFNKRSSNAIIPSIIYTLTHVVNAIFLLIIQKPSSETDSKYHRPEVSGYKHF